MSNSCNIKIKVGRYSIYYPLMDNEFIWDSVNACSIRDANHIFRSLYTGIIPEYVRDEILDKYIYENIDDNKVEFKDYLPESQRVVRRN